jgi:DUF1680 family protein
MHLAYHDAQYADLYEQTIYNALFGGMDLGGKNFYYQNPLDANQARYPWHACPCCVGNMSRTLLMLPTWMYSKDATGIYVNLFAGNTMTIDNVVGTSVELVQTTDYPWKGSVSIVVNPAASKRFAMRIRVPNRDVSSLYTTTPAANGIRVLKVNGSKVIPVLGNGYATIERTWKKGDRIELELPMVAQRVYASDKIMTIVGNQADPTAPRTPIYPTRNKVALKYGPLVYNIEAADQDVTKLLSPTSELKPEWRGDLLGGVMAITGTFADGSPMVAIPNYARLNRIPPGPDVSVPAAQQPPPPAPVAPGAPRPTPPPPPPAQSVVWIKER